MLPTNTDDSFKSYVPAGTIPPRVRVKHPTSGSVILTTQVDVAGAADLEIGVSTNDKLHTDLTQPIRIKLRNSQGTYLVTIGGAALAGTTVKRAAAGKVAIDGAGTDFGTLEEDAIADGDIREVLPLAT